jgi:hypothetical protein
MLTGFHILVTEFSHLQKLTFEHPSLLSGRHSYKLGRAMSKYETRLGEVTMQLEQIITK